MTVKSRNTFQKISDYVDRSWKMIAIIGALGTGFITISRTWDKIDRNEKEWKIIDDKYNSMIKEMMRDNKIQLDDQHDLIIKNIQRLSELKEKFNEHEISAAEFRGKVKAILKIQ